MKRAVKLAAAIYRRTERFPPSDKYVLTPQIRKVALSVLANIAEGWGRGSTEEYIQFLLIARGSLMELDSHFCIAHELDYVHAQDLEGIERETESIGKMLNRLISSLRAR